MKRGSRTAARRRSRRDVSTRSQITRSPNRQSARSRPLRMLELDEVQALRRELEQSVARSAPPRWNAEPDDVQRSVAQLVLSLVEFLRKLMERQAIRRMNEATLAPDEIEAVGLALMRLEKAVRDIGAHFGLTPEELNLDLGPLGRLS